MEAHTSATSAEAARIREVFGNRTEPGDGLFDPFRVLAHHERQEQLLRFFRECGLTSLKNLKILEIGCGSGGGLRRLVDWGAEPRNCFGVDLFGKSLSDARRAHPDIGFIEANAAQLPYGNGEFDLVSQFTVLTSVLNLEIRRAIIAEIQRVLRPGGYFIWYDFAYSNPGNPNVRGIGRKEMCALLSGFRVRYRKLTLAPPIGRPISRVSPWAYRVLAAVPFLRSHYLCFARKT